MFIYSITNEKIKKTSTPNLLNMLRIIRKEIVYSFYECYKPCNCEENNNFKIEFFDRLKKELATREHIPRKQKDIKAELVGKNRKAKLTREKKENMILLWGDSSKY